jgi:hypothetical protein
MAKWTARRLNRDRRALSKLASVSLAILLLTVGSIAVIILISLDDSSGFDHDAQSRAPRLFLNATDGDDYIQLTWNSIPWDSEFGFTVFNISRAYDGHDSTFVDSVDINQTSYADHSVSSYRSCLYFIKAIPALKFQNPSNSDFIWVEGQSNWTSLGKRASSAPLELAIRPMDEKVSLTWKAPTEDGGHWVNSYAIYRGISTEDLSLVGNFSASSIYYGDEYRDLGLTNHLSYYYAVSANNSIAESNRSNVISVTPLPAPLLSMKRLSSETDYYHQLLQINWSSSQDPMLTVTGYKLYLRPEYQVEMYLIGSYNASGPFGSLVNLTYPHDSGMLYMAVEYQDHNTSYSEPVVALIAHPMDGPIGNEWSTLLIILVLGIGILMGIGAILWKKRK